LKILTNSSRGVLVSENQDDDKTRSFTPLTKDTMVGHYRIIEKIGAGGMGEVFLAEDTRLDRKVALKFLPPHLSQDDAARARFTREAKAAAKLDHPNIVQVFEVGEFQGRPFFAMAHIEGKSLKDVIKEGRLSIDETIDLTRQICEGLHTAHESGVVHRDIKPGNIIIDRDNKARILDFGLATVAGEDKLTRTGSTLGTVGYMSPEQIEGKRVDLRSDLFSVGVILYEMLTGRRPFEGDTDAAVARSITDNNPEPIARYKSGTTGELQQIVGKALAKDPSHRYQHADDLLADLKRIEVGAPVASKLSAAKLWIATVMLVVIVGILLLLQPWRKESKSPESKKIILAVLPFSNLGEPGDSYFADGITEDITSRLGMIGGLGVISSTSTLRYKKHDRDIPKIARELGVDYILDGTIQWDRVDDTDFVRIIPRLIDCSQNTQVWTEIYDKVLIHKFQIQGEISLAVAAALNVTLAESNLAALKSPATENSAAYIAYLKGVEYNRIPSNNSDNFNSAILMFQRAIELDSNFALAWAGLANIHLRYLVFDKSDKRLQEAREAADKSLEINPELAEGHLALAAYYVVKWQYDSANTELALAEKYKPSLPKIYSLRSIIIGHEQGYTEEVLNQVITAQKLDPLDGYLLFDLAQVHWERREIDQFIECMDEAITLNPHLEDGYVIKAMLLTISGVKLDEARRIYSNPVVHEHSRLRWGTDVEIAARNYGLALAMLDSCDNVMPYLGDIDRNKRAWIHWLMGDTIAARQIYDTVRTRYESSLNGDDRRNERIYGVLAECLAVLGDSEKAIYYLEKECEFKSHSYTDMLDCRHDRAKIYTILGEYDKAIEELEKILAVKYYVSTTTLKVIPTWDPLHDHPRFKALIEKYGKEYGT